MRDQKSKTHTGKRQEGRLADSMQAAASQMGYDIAALKTAKREGCKAFKAGSRVDIFELEEWFANHPEIQSTVDAKITEKQAGTIEKVSKALQRRDNYRKFRRELIHQDEMRRTFTRAFSECKSKLMAIPSAQSQTLAMMKDPVEIDSKLRQVIRDALEGLSKNEWAVLSCPNCQKEIKV